MSKPLKGGTLGESLAEEIDEVHDRDLGWGEWATLVAKNYFGIHLSQLWLVSIGRRFGWLEGGSDSEFSEFSELSTMQTGPKPDRDVEAAIALWLEGAKVGNADAQHALATHLASPAFLGVEGRDGKVGSLLRDYFAALGGTTLAQMTLGYRHLMGYGVPKSCETAATFYELAANQAVLAMRKMSGIRDFAIAATSLNIFCLHGRRLPWIDCASTWRCPGSEAVRARGDCTERNG